MSKRQQLALFRLQAPRKGEKVGKGKGQFPNAPRKVHAVATGPDGALAQQTLCVQYQIGSLAWDTGLSAPKELDPRLVTCSLCLKAFKRYPQVYNARLQATAPIKQESCETEAEAEGFYRETVEDEGETEEYLASRDAEES